ncbi:lipid-binding SYLF domain-containing protein [Sulfurospirillum sp. 1612]|uniref:lipid-binding SYLF domain-containing protein n=1 Tax=Sulfurospirillum sp. 1612 TaxID=3094835 RepID=UPI002F95EA84
MRKLLVLLLLSCAFFASILNANMEQERRVLTASKILQEALFAPKTGITKALLHNAKAIAVFPNTVKGAFLIGGRVGDGVMSVKDMDGAWSEPIFVSLKGVSVGFQIGVQSTDIIMIFKTERSIDGLSTGKLTLGVDAGVVAAAKGVKAGDKTDEKLAADIKTFGKSSGLFIGVSLSGSTLTVNDTADFNYYDTIIYVNDILTHDKIKNKPESEEFKRVLRSL